MYRYAVLSFALDPQLPNTKSAQFIKQKPVAQLAKPSDITISCSIISVTETQLLASHKTTPQINPVKH